jgi:hypothetical protein
LKGWQDLPNADGPQPYVAEVPQTLQGHAPKPHQHRLLLVVGRIVVVRRIEQRRLRAMLARELPSQLRPAALLAPLQLDLADARRQDRSRLCNGPIHFRISSKAESALDRIYERLEIDRQTLGRLDALIRGCGKSPLEVTDGDLDGLLRVVLLTPTDRTVPQQ